MQVTIVTPDASFYDGKAEQVALAAWDGEIGILPGHAPLIARLGHGVARVFDGAKTHRIGVYGGFVKVQDDQVTVLAGGAALPEGDPAAAKKELDEAQQAVAEAVGKAASGPELAEVEERLRRARTRYDLLSA